MDGQSERPQKPVGRLPALKDDGFNLKRFVSGQDPIYHRITAELRQGSKQSHWMWFVFPQIAGLGSSVMSQRFAISSLGEARAFLAHPILGGRLQECTQLVVDVQGRTAHQIFGSPDDLKFHSSMTLFAEISSANSIFHAALENYFSGAKDPTTFQKLPSHVGD